ncbi:MAG: signal peptidase II [Rothia sp. (in: high G+C Gram-positive bacteria)]|nr:signal peptidase II [Rothia sp. (in: high G+C Gram-positive bacteria)]
MATIDTEEQRLVPTRTLVGRRKAVLALGIFLTVYGADQVIKYIVESTMYLGQSITVIEGLVWWRYYLNPGAAFSMGESSTWIFTIISTIAAIVCLAFISRARSASWVLALSVLAGGIVGNLHDRLFRAPGFGVGHVVDYVSVPNFAIFNLADSAICVSMAVIVLLTFLGVRLDGHREVSADKVTQHEGTE